MRLVLGLLLCTLFSITVLAGEDEPISEAFFPIGAFSVNSIEAPECWIWSLIHA